MTGLTGIQASTQVAQARQQVRASGVAPGEPTDATREPAEAWAPSGGAAKAPTGLNTELMLRLSAHAMEAAHASSLLAMMPGLPALSTTLAINEKSGVFSSTTRGLLGGSITKFSLPGGTEVWRNAFPGDLNPDSPMQESFSAFAPSPLSLMDPTILPARASLPVTVNPDKTVQVTNPDGTLTVLDPQALTVRQGTNP